MWTIKKRIIGWFSVIGILTLTVFGGITLFRSVTAPKTAETPATVASEPAEPATIKFVSSAVAEETAKETIVVEPFEAKATVKSGTTAYMGPGTNYERIVIISDNPLKVVGKYGTEWYVVELGDNLYGFIEPIEAVIELLKPEATATPEPKATATPKPTATPEPKATATPKPEATSTPEPTKTKTQDFGRWVVMDPARTAEYKGVAGEIYNGARVGTLKDTPIYKETSMNGEPLAVIPMNAMLWVLETRGNLVSLRYTYKGKDVVAYTTMDTLVLIEKK